MELKSIVECFSFLFFSFFLFSYVVSHFFYFFYFFVLQRAYALDLACKRWDWMCVSRDVNHSLPFLAFLSLSYFLFLFFSSILFLLACLVESLRRKQRPDIRRTGKAMFGQTVLSQFVYVDLILDALLPS